MDLRWTQYQALGEKLAPGFATWEGARGYWELRKPLGWAVYCFKNGRMPKPKEADPLIVTREDWEAHCQKNRLNPLKEATRQLLLGHKGPMELMKAERKEVMA